MFTDQSETTCKDFSTNDPIHVFLQFYIDKNDFHFKEIQFALKKNVENPYITSIILLNERLYTVDELGVTSNKIHQVILSKRLTYSIFLKYPIIGYKVLINADIYVDDSILNIKTSDIHLYKKMYALLRYEHGNPPILFGANTTYDCRGDSADTWIIHSNHTFTKKELSIFNFNLGVPGCDNKVAYLFSILGYTLYNDPLYIKSYHCHKSITRNYSYKLKPPYMCILPANLSCPNPFNVSTTVNLNVNTTLFYKLKDQHVIIPQADEFDYASFLKIKENFPINCVKLNSSICISSFKSARLYMKWYLKAFRKCAVYSSYEPWEKMYAKTLPVLSTMNKQYLSIYVFDIFNFIHNPWTHALANKRILIISPFVDIIRTQPNAYPIDLFPGCTFIYIKSPDTGVDWITEFIDLCDSIKLVENDFDVALCSCGGYGNPVCTYIYSLNKSAIYVGDVLSIYFGIYNDNWFMNNKEIMSLYLTNTWKRSKI
jgi:hypothetical protein